MSEEPKATPLRLKAQPSQNGGTSESASGQVSSPPSGAAGSGDSDGPIRLKLKPRPPLQEPLIPPASAPAPLPPEEPGQPQGAGPKIRIKPKLAADPEAKGEGQAAEPNPEPASVPNALFVPEPTEPPPPPAAPLPSPPAPGAEPAPTEAPLAEKSVAPFLVVPSLSQTPHSPSRPPFAVGPAKVPHIKGPEGTVTEPVPPVDPTKRKGFKIGVALVGVLSVVVLVVGAYALWKLLPRPTTKPVYLAQSPTAGAVKPTAGSKQKLPSSMTQVQSLISATHNAEQARVDALAAGHEPPSVASQVLGSSPGTAATPAPQGQPASAASGRTPPAPAASSFQAPRPPAEVVRVTAPPEASPAFRRFVANASIPGVFQGNPPRALINGCTVQAGELADRELRIIFVRIDADKKTITFRDDSGAEVTRHY